MIIKNFFYNDCKSSKKNYIKSDKKMNLIRVKKYIIYIIATNNKKHKIKGDKNYEEND